MEFLSTDDCLKELEKSHIRVHGLQALAMTDLTYRFVVTYTAPWFGYAPSDGRWGTLSTLIEVPMGLLMGAPKDFTIFQLGLNSLLDSARKHDAHADEGSV